MSEKGKTFDIPLIERGDWWEEAHKGESVWPDGFWTVKMGGVRYVGEILQMGIKDLRGDGYPEPFWTLECHDKSRGIIIRITTYNSLFYRERGNG